MKTTISFTLFFLLCIYSFGQGILERQFFGIGGTSGIADDIQLCWSLGENFVSTLEQGDCVLTQGFLQPDMSMSNAVIKMEGLDIHYKVFPNPTLDYMNFELSGLPGESLYLQLIDLEGRIWIQANKILLSEGKIIQLDLSGFPSGTYILQCYNDALLNVLNAAIQKYH